MDKFLNFFKTNLTYIIIIWIIFTIVSPYLFTREWNIINFSGTGEIGDTIGGVTAPVINILNAILIYIAFTEQLKANNLIKKQLDDEKLKEVDRLENIKQLILFDLKNKISPTIEILKNDLNQYIEDKKNNNTPSIYDYVDFNSIVYDNLKHEDLLKIFDQDFKLISQIYSRVNFISEMTPVNISKRYPTDKDGLQLIKLSNHEYDRIRINHNNKIIYVLEGILKNTIPSVEYDLEWILKGKKLFNDTEDFSGL